MTEKKKAGRPALEEKDDIKIQFTSSGTKRTKIQDYLKDIKALKRVLSKEKITNLKNDELILEALREYKNLLLEEQKEK